jgi:hypothetical protein
MAHHVHPSSESGRGGPVGRAHPRRLRPPRAATAWLVAALSAGLVASACVTGPGVPGGGGDPDPTTPTTESTPGTDPTSTSTTTPGPGGACARDTSLPQPGDVAVQVSITGKVVQRNGEPVRDGGGHARIVDRAQGQVLAEASVNDAGFFLLRGGTSTVPADVGCRDYWIEICALASAGCATTGGVTTLTAERDITDLVNGAAGQAPLAVDMSDDPLIYEPVE